MTVEFWCEALKHRFPGFLDLKKQRRAVAAREQTDGAERADTSNPNGLEGDILERVSFKQTQPLWRKSLLVRCKDALGVDAVPRIALSGEVIDQRRIVYDARLLTLYQMRKIVVLFDSLACLGQDGMQLPSQSAILDIFNFLHQLDPAVPDFKR